ncbi:MAG: hypothetical protein JWO94_403 [Verrucomicrobiaceae bacterium]|nr:hypothetical protein [Verrucomicrobiaceae bacterium]
MDQEAVFLLNAAAGFFCLPPPTIAAPGGRPWPSARGTGPRRAFSLPPPVPLMIRRFIPLLALPLLAFAVDDKPGGAPDSKGGLQPADRSATPQIAPASEEAANVRKNIQPPAGMKVDLWAAEPMLANPVALSIDERGRVFVAETHRLGSSVLDIRNYMFLLDDDLASRSVADRLAMCHKFFGAQFDDLGKEEDCIRLLEDRDHHGYADFNSIYAGGFNKPEDGIAAGVLARHDHVWATLIPNLWSFTGTDDNGVAKSRESLSYGYGIRFGYTGHDMHGLIMGPDGRLYFSIGDRAANVVTKEGRHIENLNSGAVFRCEPDGANLELVHTGLRNPQELAFDDFGNLFTGDNDFDYGDTERLVYVVEGGDSGWRVGYQHPPLGKERVTWKAEQTWVAFGSSQDKYNGAANPNPNIDLGVRSTAYLPPVTNIGDGPSGFLFDPGTGISPAFRHHFFLCHSKGSYAKSEIHAFTLKEEGATFELGESKPFVKFIHSPDLDIAPDGSIYFLDWSETMSKTAKGRIFRMYDPAVLEDPKTLETKRLIEEGMAKRGISELSQLLGHEDRRVRMEAQFELVKRKEADALKQAAASKGVLLSRLHAIWGLGQLGRKDQSTGISLLALLIDNESEVRAQAAKMLGEDQVDTALPQLVAGLEDDNARVRFFAAQALGNLKSKGAVPALVSALTANNDKDPYLRHACVTALARINDEAFFAKDFRKEPLPVQMGVLLAMKQLKHPGITQFLNSSLPIKLVAEAARAINDGLIPECDKELAATKPASPDAAGSPLVEPLMLRVIEARRRLGNVTGLIQLAMDDKLPGAGALRVDCLDIVGETAQPMQRDRVLGISRPIKRQSNIHPAPLLAKAIQKLSSAASANDPDRVPVLLAAIGAAQKLEAKTLAPQLAALISDTTQPASVRSAAMLAIGGWDDKPAIEAAVKAAQASNDPALRRASLQLLPHCDPAEAVAVLKKTMAEGSLGENAEALGILSKIKGEEAETMLEAAFDGLTKGSLAPELQLEVIEAAKASPSARIQGWLKTYLDALPKTRTTAAFPFLQAGGDPVAGKKIFFEHTAAQCVRCHKIGGKGSEVGPILDGIGKRQPRDYILESVLFPNNKIAQGFEMTMVTTKDGKGHGGMVRKETATELHLSPPVPNAPVEIVNKADIATRSPGVSAMPEMFQQVLTQREIRDLVAYLSGLQK